MTGLDMADVAVDGCLTKAPCGGDNAGRSPVHRGKSGLERSQPADGAGVPMATVSAPADRKSTRLNSSHANISYAVFCLKKKKSHTQSHSRIFSPIVLLSSPLL